MPARAECSIPVPTRAQRAVLIELNGKRFLVAPRGRTQWVRNAEAAGEITLKRRSFRQNFRLRDSFRRREAGCTEGLS